MKKFVIVTIVSIFTIMLSACGRSKPNDLAGTRWVLIGFGQNHLIEGIQLTIEFEESQVSGSTGCNLFSGGYQLDGDEISFGALAWTEIGCMEPEGVMEQERTYMDLLGAAERFELKEDELKIFAGSQGSLIFEKPGDSSNDSSPPSPIPPMATAETQAPTEMHAFEPPSGFKEHQATSIGVSLYIPESWLESTVVEGQYVILQSYPVDKYVGGEPREPGDSKCDLGLRPEGESMSYLIEQWKSDSMTTIISEGEILLGSGLLALRVELDNRGRANVIITEINERVVILTCFGDFTHFDEIAVTLKGSE